MSIESRQSDIIALIQKNGPMGVNAIQREINIPLATLQKWLHNQSYFKINDSKKWDLPENVIGEIKGNSLSLMVNGVENNILLLKSQLEEMMQHADNALVPINSLKRGISAMNVPVAGTSDNSIDIDPRLLELTQKGEEATKLIKHYKGNIPEEYKELLLNLDFVGLIIGVGREYANNLLNDEVSPILMQKSDELSEDAVETLKEYQKGA